jgi:lipopolysaccharide/colanic/teichoic acid biosynthesis glycosyltransferase
MPAPIQRVLALIALVVLAPALTILAMAIRATSPGPVLYRATRVGSRGTFTLYKFRTMRQGKDASGSSVTAAGDRRVTQLGGALRRSKLDELPQLWNVVRGNMLLVGPRPEDPRFVDLADQLHRRVFAAPPGITGPTALAFRDEERLLAKVSTAVAVERGRDSPTPSDIDDAYRREILPEKLAMDAEYLATRSTRGDVAILGRTIGQVLRRISRR